MDVPKEISISRDSFLFFFPSNSSQQCFFLLYLMVFFLGVKILVNG